MSEDKKIDGVNNDQNPVDKDLNGDPKEDKVSYDTYRKTLSEAKSAKEKTKALEAELEKLRQAELEAKGKDKELAESLRKQLEQEKAEKNKIKQDFAFQIYTKAVKAELSKAGALDEDLLINAIDINAVGINDDFTFNEDDIKREVANLAAKKPKLFQKKAPSVKDGTPKNVDSKELNGQMDLSKMTLAQKMQKLAELTANGSYSKK